MSLMCDGCRLCMCFADKLTHLYTLVIRKDNTFSVYIDGESVKDSSLLTGMTPPINPPKVPTHCHVVLQWAVGIVGIVDARIGAALCSLAGD